MMSMKKICTSSYENAPGYRRSFFTNSPINTNIDSRRSKLSCTKSYIKTKDQKDIDQCLQKHSKICIDSIVAKASFPKKTSISSAFPLTDGKRPHAPGHAILQRCHLDTIVIKLNNRFLRLRPHPLDTTTCYKQDKKKPWRKMVPYIQFAESYDLKRNTPILANGQRTDAGSSIRKKTIFSNSTHTQQSITTANLDTYTFRKGIHSLDFNNIPTVNGDNQ